MVNWDRDSYQGTYAIRTKPIILQDNGMAHPSDLVSHYSNRAFQTRIYALTFVGIVLAASIDHLDKPNDANLIGTILIIVVASLAELNRRYTHSYLCACKASAQKLEGNTTNDNTYKYWELFRKKNEQPWNIPLTRGLLSWSTYLPGLFVGIYLILKNSWPVVNSNSWPGLLISAGVLIWWTYISFHHTKKQKNMTSLSRDKSKGEFVYNFPSGPVSNSTMYKQGSEACRNYSRLTMRVRTLGQQVFVISAIGLGTLYFTKCKPQEVEQLMIFGGVVLIGFAISLLLVDWHYQSAFMSIRDCLANLEFHSKSTGPWRSHLEVRSRLYDHLASYIPFLLLILLGCYALWQGNANTCIIMVILIIFVSIFVYNGFQAASRDKHMARRLSFPSE